MRAGNESGSSFDAGFGELAALRMGGAPDGYRCLPGVYPVFSGPEGLPEGLVVQKPAPSRLRGGLAVRRASVQVGSR